MLEERLHRAIEAARNRLMLGAGIDAVIDVVPTRGALEELMERGTYQYQSDFARKYIAKGLQKGQEEGLQKGLQKGLYEGERTALLKVLEARGLVVKPRARQRILACTHPAQLERWLRKAVSVRSTEELFEPGRVARHKAGKRP